jgi:hypothetical protein
MPMGGQSGKGCVNSDGRCAPVGVFLPLPSPAGSGEQRARRVSPGWPLPVVADAVHGTVADRRDASLYRDAQNCPFAAFLFLPSRTAKRCHRPYVIRGGVSRVQF